MANQATFEKPPGFDEWLTATLAKCIAQSIVREVMSDLQKGVNTDAISDL